MTVKIRFPRPMFSGFRQGSTTLAAAGMPSGASFHAALTDFTEDWVVQGSLRTAAAVARPVGPVQTREVQTHEIERSPGMLVRAWDWINSKYALTTTKRLRVSETVSLGEKRFVALVCVEGREFLVGGGASGVSLLAQLGEAPASGQTQLGRGDVQ